MISQAKCQTIEALMPVRIPDAEKYWKRMGVIDREMVRPMLPVIRQRRLIERKEILNKLRISYT